MSTQDEIYDLLLSIERSLLDLPAKLKLIPNQITIVKGLSEISESLGTVLAGEFRTGISSPGNGFSGMRMAYPAMEYGGELWNLVGVENDTLQFGIRSSDGKAFAGGGAVTLDEEGVTILKSYGGVEGGYADSSIKFRYPDHEEWSSIIDAYYDNLYGTDYLDIRNVGHYGEHPPSDFKPYISIATGYPLPGDAYARILLSSSHLTPTSTINIQANGYVVIGGGAYVTITSGLIIGSSAGLTPTPTAGELWLKEIASGATPRSGYGALYVKTDGKLYFKNDAGTETALT